MKKDDEKLRKYEVDGIKEYDNPLPSWWIGLFVLTVAFSAVYFVYYQIGNGPTLTEELLLAQEKFAKKQMTGAQDPANSPKNDFNHEILSDTKRISEGKKIFTSTCSPCHGSDGGGGIGPNLTDDHWIHGCTKEAIFKVIKEGVLEKGMAAWGPVFDDEKIQSITSYVLSLSETTPQNPKAKEGVFCDVKGSPTQP